MSYRRFLFLFGTLMCFLSLLIVMFFFYLSRIYEYNSYAEIVKRQVKNNSLYGTKFNDFPGSYFLELVGQRKPEIISFGSSRSAWFKEKYFNRSFVTTPKASDSFLQMEAFIDRVLQIHIPKVVIIEFDPWLLLENPECYVAKTPVWGDEKIINFSKIYNALKLLVVNHMPIKNPFNDSSVNKYTDHDSLGIYAITMANGYLKDGSYFHGSTYFGQKPNYKKILEIDMMRIKKNQGAFRWAKVYDSKNIIFLQKLIKKLQEYKILVIPIVMPIPPIVYQESYIKHPDKYAYWKELDDNAKKIGLYDFLNPSSIKTNDCEFLDAIHPGDVASARVLKKIGEENPDFAKYLNMKEIDWAINNRAGHVYSGKDFGKYKEVDFLDLGCKKH